MMKTSPRGRAVLMHHEGIVPGPYIDSVGVWTVYVGHTAAAGSPDPENMTRGMPSNLGKAVKNALDQFELDLEKYEAGVRRAFTVPLTQHEFDAAVSFHYNTGAIGTAAWVKAYNEGDRAKAIAQIMNWKKPEAIIPRRKAEQKLFAEGVYPEGNVHVWRVREDGRVIWQPVKTYTQDEIIKIMTKKPAPSKSSTAILVGTGAAAGAAVASTSFWCKVPFIVNLFNLTCGG